MRPLLATLVLAVAATAIAAAAGQPRPRTAPPARTGTIRGHIRLDGRAPGNPVLRMGMDPKCADLNRGRQVIQEQALVTRDGSVANVFVRLDGPFAPTPVPKTPVVIDQRACIYTPRVAGVRVGQPLQIRNDDDLLHNVHSLSTGANSFNVGQPKAGLAYEFTPRAPEVMLKLGCDVHRWMTAYVAVMTHPYFAVTDGSGSYTISNVPPGSYTLKVWHEQFGEQSRRISVAAGQATTADLVYPARP